MSLLTNQTSLNASEFFFLRGSGQEINVSSLNANTISTNTLTANSTIANQLSTILLDANDINASTIFAYEVFIDNQGLTASPTELLLNGVPLATTSNLSSIADWAYDPAISTVNMAGNNLISTNNILASNINAGTGMFNTLFANNIFALSTYTSTVSSLAEVADFGFFTTVSAGTASFGSVDMSGGSLYAGAADFSTLWGQPSSFYQNALSTINSGDIVCSTLTASNYISTADLRVSSINGNEITPSSITTNTISTNTAEISSIVSVQLSSVIGNVSLQLASSINLNPSFSLGGVNLGLGSLFGNLGGAALGGLGVLVGGAALGTGVAALTQGRQTNYINSNNYELVNGTTQLQVSSLGTAFSTIYRFVSSSAENVPGEEIFISTVYPPGVAIRSASDPLNTVSAPNSTIQSFGQWVALDYNLPIPSTTSTFSELFTSSLRASTVSLVNDQNLRAGAPYLNSASGISSLEIFDSSGPLYSGALRANQINFSYAGLSSNDYSQDVLLYNFGGGANPPRLRAGNAAGAGTIAYLSDIPGAPSTISTFQTASISSATISSVNNGIPYTTANPQPIPLSSITASSISVSSCATSTLTINGASVINISTSAAAGAQGQPAGRLIISGNDVDFGQNDVWAQQIRLGAGNPTNAQSEIIFYDANANQRGLQTALLDRTIRVVSTINANQGGYILDTGINPPFFSTIAGQVNLMAWFPSSINSTIGVSTLSVFPAQAQNTGTFSSLNVSSLNNFQSTLYLQNTNSGANLQLNWAGDIIGVAPNGYVNFQAISSGTAVAGYLLNAGGLSGSSSNYTAGPMYLNASSIRMSTNQVQCVNLSTANIGVSTINNLPVVFQPTSAFSSNILWTNLSTSSNCIASTSISVQSPSYILAQANTSVKNTTNQYHTSYAYLTINGFTSPSTITTAANNNGSFAGQSIAFRTAVSTGTYNVALFAYADTNGDLQVSQTDIWATGNLG